MHHIHDYCTVICANLAIYFVGAKERQSWILEGQTDDMPSSFRFLYTWILSMLSTILCAANSNGALEHSNASTKRNRRRV